MSLLLELIKGYFYNGWPFAIAHLGIVGLIVVDSYFLNIRKETNILTKWRPQPKSVDPSLENLNGTEFILNRFISEVQALAPQGFFVSMTDFSDRLDSIIDGMIAEIHDRTNLLLIVGVAGTLFGVFEFAFKSASDLGSNSIETSLKVVKLAEYLSSSMAKAFPIGFVGLVLTILFQILVAFPERKLRNALAIATDNALKEREELSESQSEIVRQSAESIGRAMEPLKDLKETLTDSIQPVVKEFGLRLDQSLTLVRQQFEQLESATLGVQTAVVAVNAGIESLHSMTANLGSLLQDTPTVLKNVIALQNQQVKNLDIFELAMRKSLSELSQILSLVDKAAASIEQLPTTLLSQTVGLNKVLIEEFLSNWKTLTEDLGGRIHALYSNYLRDVAESGIKLSASTEITSRELQSLAASANVCIQNLSALPSDISAAVITTVEKCGQESVGIWSEMAGGFGREVEGEYSAFLKSVRLETEQTKTNLDKSSEHLAILLRDGKVLLEDSFERGMAVIKSEVIASLGELDSALANKYPEAIQNILGLAEGSHTVLGQIKELEAAFGKLVGSIKSVSSDFEKGNTRVEPLPAVPTPIVLGSKEVISTMDLFPAGDHFEVTRTLLESIVTQLSESNRNIDTKLQELVEAINSTTREIHAASPQGRKEKRGQRPGIRGRLSRIFKRS